MSEENNFYSIPWYCQSGKSPCMTEMENVRGLPCRQSLQSTQSIYLFESLISNWRLTHWGRVTHICVSKLTIIGSDNGLSPDRRQAIIWTNAGLLLIGPSGTNFSEILIEIIFIQENAFESVVCETAAILSRPQCVNATTSNIFGWIKSCWHFKSRW